VHTAISSGPPGHRVSPGIASQVGIEELVERLGRVFLGVASPGVVPGIRIPPGETGREERVSSERVQTVLDRMTLRPGRVQQFVDSDVEHPVGLVPDISEEAGASDADAVRCSPAQRAQLDRSGVERDPRVLLDQRHQVVPGKRLAQLSAAPLKVALGK